MFNISEIFHKLERGNIPLPTLFTYPFQYTPHPLSISACDELKEYLRAQNQWNEEIQRGKMFGVLVVKSDSDENIYYLAAFSGLLNKSNTQQGFVPPVYDSFREDGYYITKNNAICEMPEGEEKHNQSRELQQWLFKQYNFLNAKGEEKNLIDIFKHETCRIPPSGAGECCAPKLLQYAYLNHMHPLCMAEFWLGDSPQGEVRYDGEYYPACHAKCKPILRHMLQGLDVEENPLIPRMRMKAEKMKIIYEDDYLIAVNKPEGMLSVKGNVDAPSVEERIQAMYPDITGPLIVHRLDMDTSGIMIIAKNKEIHKALQTQFFKREITKKYVALLEREITNKTGIIDLPLSPNIMDRPRQMVNYEYGKNAITEYEVVEVKDGLTRIHFYPHTGRTHQLRVHAAHQDGLNAPILGDRLYSRTYSESHPRQSMSTQLDEYDNRMYLHSQSIEFTHPILNKRILLEVNPDF